MSEDAFVPFIPHVAQHVLGVLRRQDVEEINLACQAIDTLGCLATSPSSPTHFAPYVADCT